MLTASSIIRATDGPGQPGAILPVERSMTGRAQAKPKILVVDDEKLIAETTGEILEAFGFQVEVAYEGWSALERASRFRPDHLLSDILMPHMNGVELAIAVRKMLPAVKILLFSGQAGIKEMLSAAKEQGFEFDLIAKPIHPLKLIERLKGQ